MKWLALAIFTIYYLLFIISSANAEECQAVYGGGLICTQAKTEPPKPTPKPTKITTTKGKMTVFPASQTTENPATGPELIPLLALLPSGLLGALLRKKSVE